MFTSLLKNLPVKNSLNKIKVNIARFLTRFVPQAVFEQHMQLSKAKDDYSQVYYSQEGEEIILRRFFKFSNTGFFVDIGAHHPQKFSNTYKLYVLGWRGINIDATPGSMELFKKYRPGDINIEAAIADNEDTLTFYEFNEAALNSFDREKVKKIDPSLGYRIIKESSITTTPLKTILDKYVPPLTKIDFFSIDAEGFDLKILKGNDWTRYRPQVILIETDTLNLEALGSNEVSLYVAQYGYKPFAKTYKTVFYSLCQ